MSTGACTHLQSGPVDDVVADECPACVAAGSGWVHLRGCAECGHIGCCDSSPNQHARQHAQANGHPVIVSAERDERWAYCFVHDAVRPI